MKDNTKQQWIDFCNEHITEHMPLFKTDGLKPIINETKRKIGHEFVHGDKLIKHVQNVVDNAKNKTTKHKGVVYIAYTLESDLVVPFYIGKSEFKGRTREFSANVSSRPNGPFLRWGARRDYHLGELMYAYRNDDKATNKYKTWADYLFEKVADGKFEYGNLKKTAYLAMIPLDTITVPNLPYKANVSQAEYSLIGTAGYLFPNDLQNFEGRSRR